MQAYLCSIKNSCKFRLFLKERVSQTVARPFSFGRHRWIWTPVPTDIDKNAIENGQSGTPVPTDIDKNAIDNGQSGTPVPTNIERANSACSQFASTFKRFCNKEYGESIWQARFNDHIIRNRADYEEHVKYIYENPMRWYYDELYAEE